MKDGGDRVPNSSLVAPGKNKKAQWHSPGDSSDLLGKTHVLTFVRRMPLPPFFTSAPSRHYSNWYCTCFEFIISSAHTGFGCFFFLQFSWKKSLSVWVEFLKAVSAAMINRYATWEGRNSEGSSASSHKADVRLVPFLHGLLRVCGCARDATHLLLAVKVAARAMPGSLLFRPVGESTLPVLRGLECRGKALGWSSLKKGNIHSLQP